MSTRRIFVRPSGGQCTENDLIKLKSKQKKSQRRRRIPGACSGIANVTISICKRKAARSGWMVGHRNPPGDLSNGVRTTQLQDAIKQRKKVLWSPNSSFSRVYYSNGAIIKFCLHSPRTLPYLFNDCTFAHVAMIVVKIWIIPMIPSLTAFHAQTSPVAIIRLYNLGIWYNLIAEPAARHSSTPEEE